MDDGLAVKFLEKELKQANKAFENALVVKVVGNKIINRVAFKTILRELWQPVEGLKFTEVERSVFIVTFQDEIDRDRILSKGPWRFMGWAIQIERWSPGKQIKELFSRKIQIWVQIHNLPIEYRNAKFAIRFAEKAGTVIQVPETRSNYLGQDEIRKYCRFRIETDIMQIWVQIHKTHGSGMDFGLWLTNPNLDCIQV